MDVTVTAGLASENRSVSCQRVEPQDRVSVVSGLHSVLTSLDPPHTSLSNLLSPLIEMSLDSLLSNIPSLLGGVLTSRPATVAAAALLGASYLDAKLGLGRDLTGIRRGQRSLKALTDVAINTGKWNISYRWSESVERSPDKVAFRTPAIEEGDSGRSWTYAQADDQINKMAKWLKEEVGVGYGDRVALVFENSVEYLFTLLAIQKLGGVHVPQNFNLRGAGFIHCVSIVSPVAIIFEDRMAHIFDNEVSSAMRAKGVKMYCYDFTQGRANIGVNVDGMVSEEILDRKYPGRVEPPSDDDGRKQSKPTDPAQMWVVSKSGWSASSAKKN